MKNPGLSAFAEWRNDPDDDVDEHEEDVADPPYDRPEHFNAKWNNPGYPVHEVIPATAGKRLNPDTAKDVIHGEIIHPDEEAGADDILKGGTPSHPGVAEFQHHLAETPAAGNAVKTLSHLVSGGSPHTATDYDDARDYLRKRFRQVTANPRHGTLVVRGKSTQVVRRKEQEGAEPTYEVENKHGIFDYPRPDRAITAMMAFEFINHEKDYKKEKEEEEQDDDQNQQKVSAWFNRTPRNIPQGAVFEPYAGGTEYGTAQFQGPKGKPITRTVRGGYVMDTPASIPAGSPLENWVHHNGVSYSPGHPEGWRHDPTLGSIPRPDRFAQGHTFTFYPTATHSVPRQDKEGNQYYVRPSHPQVRQGINVPPAPKAPKAPKVPKAPPAAAFPVSAIPAGPSGSSGAPPPPTAYGPVTSAVRANDLCPVCASGYLEPYDDQHHECLNCGSLVTHVGFERQASIDNSRQDWSTEKPAHALGPKPVEFASQNQHDLLGELGWGLDRPNSTYYKEREGLSHAMNPEPDGSWTHTWAINGFPEEYSLTHPDFGTAMNSVIEINNGSEPDERYQKISAARPKGGLGRGIGGGDRDKITDPGASARGMGLNDDGSAKVVDPTEAQSPHDTNPNVPDEPLESANYHPLRGQVVQYPDELYQAPTELREKGHVRRREAAAEPVDLDKHLLENYGLQRQESYQDDAPPVYMGPVPGRSGAMATLKQQMPDKKTGKPGKWVLGVGGVQPDVNGQFKFDQFEDVERPTELTGKHNVMPVPPTRESPTTHFNVLAMGWHPTKDEHFAGELHRLMNPETGGMSSWPVRRTRETPFYPPEQPAPPHESEGVFAEPFNRNEQRRLRGLSSVENPGVSRFVS